METDTIVSEKMTDDAIRENGIKILERELGVANARRFLLLFDRQTINKGHGNYTEERHQWLDQLSMEDVLVQLHAMREGNTE